jgi:hypothetical protein
MVFLDTTDIFDDFEWVQNAGNLDAEGRESTELMHLEEWNSVRVPLLVMCADMVRNPRKVTKMKIKALPLPT